MTLRHSRLGSRVTEPIQGCFCSKCNAWRRHFELSWTAARNDRKPGDWDLLEINEAYAATPLVSALVLADSDRAQADRIRDRTNIHGGAVAIGHPLGASGARLVLTLINAPPAHQARQGGKGPGRAAMAGWLWPARP
jgi:acetyl-CoA acetyltransferase